MSRNGKVDQNQKIHYFKKWPAGLFHSENSMSTRSSRRLSLARLADKQLDRASNNLDP